MTDKEKIENAIDVAYNYAQIDGGHHKMWVIDQMMRCLLGDKYEEWVEKYEYTDENGNSTTEQYYEWDTGIAP